MLLRFTSRGVAPVRDNPERRKRVKAEPCSFWIGPLSNGDQFNPFPILPGPEQNSLFTRFKGAVAHDHLPRLCHTFGRQPPRRIACRTVAPHPVTSCLCIT